MGEFQWWLANRNVVCTARNMVTPQHLAIDEYKWHNEIAKWSGSGKENILSNRRIVFAVILINKNSLRACWVSVLCACMFEKFSSFQATAMRRP